MSRAQISREPPLQCAAVMCIGMAKDCARMYVAAYLFTCFIDVYTPTPPLRPAPSMWVLIESYMSTMTVVHAVAWWWHDLVHSPQCAIMANSVVTAVALVRMDMLTGAAAFLVMKLLPASLQWFPAKRVRTTANAVPLHPANVGHQASAASGCDRYDEAAWGVMWERTAGGRGNKAARTNKAVDTCSDAPRNNARTGMVNLGACRALLAKLSIDDLRARLQNSAWRQGKANICESWLIEAAAAFSVSLKVPKVCGWRARMWKTKAGVIEEVLHAVRLHKQASDQGGAAARDHQRRIVRAAALRTPNDVAHARRQLPLIPPSAETCFEQVKESILLYECPEALRIDVVDEFIKEASMLPTGNADDEAERRASTYVQSALARRHMSTATGLQLTTEQVNQWEGVLRGHAAHGTQLWQGDPILNRAVAFYREHGRLAAQKYNQRCQDLADVEREEDVLARSLDQVRRAKAEDVYDCVRGHGRARNKLPVLIRRKLTMAEVDLWETTFGAAWQWFPGSSPSASDADSTDSGPPTRLRLPSMRTRCRFVRPHFVFQEVHRGPMDVY